MVKQEKAVLRTTGENVKNCVIIRKDKKGQFYWVSVFANGNYGDKPGNMSDDVTSCTKKIKSSFAFWRKKMVTNTTGDVIGGVVKIYYDYKGATRSSATIALK